MTERLSPTLWPDERWQPPQVVWLPKEQCHDEWARVQEMRRTDHPLIDGGNYRNV